MLSTPIGLEQHAAEFAVSVGDGLRDGAVALFSSLQAEAASMNTKADALLTMGKVRAPDHER